MPHLCQRRSIIVASSATRPHRFVLLSLRSHIALMLLLAFVRVLVPDELLLALHPHRHTEHEVAHEGKGLKAIVSAKHVHCPTDHLFNAPALPAPTFVFGVRVPTRFARPRAEEVTSHWAGRLVQTLCLRGPPIG
jgi:hypothetical protein